MKTNYQPLSGPGRAGWHSLLLAGALLLALATSCTKNALPIINYQPVANFKVFDKGNGNVVGANGIYTVYRITSIHNVGDAKKPAAPFQFKLKNLFVGNNPKVFPGNSTLVDDASLNISGYPGGLLAPLSYNETIAANTVKDYKNGQFDQSLYFIIFNSGETDPLVSNALSYQPEGDNVALPAKNPSTYVPVFLAPGTGQGLIDAKNKAP